MGEAVGVDLSGRLLLQAVVADGLGGAEGLVEVARLEVAARVDGAGPDAGVAVGLQLLADRQLVRLAGSAWLSRSTSELVPVWRWT